MPELLDLEEGDKRFGKSKCGRFDISNSRFWYFLCLSFLTRHFLMLYQRFTYFWRCSLRKLLMDNQLVLMRKKEFKLPLFDYFQNFVLINLILPKTSPRLHLNAVHKSEVGVASRKDDWWLFDDCSTLVLISEKNVE